MRNEKCQAEIKDSESTETEILYKNNSATPTVSVNANVSLIPPAGIILKYFSIVALPLDIGMIK